jgi:murein L,D-transpeptidase YcbB/YkuD
MQSAALEDNQARYATQLQKTEESAKQVASLQDQLSAARSEIRRLTVQAEETGAELAKVRDQLATAQQAALPLAGGISPEVLRIKPRPTRQDVMAAQEALTQLRFGTLEADGVIGPSTRQAIEDFQRAAGLQVTGELHAQTLVALTRAAKVMAAQNERIQQPL